MELNIIRQQLNLGISLTQLKLRVVTYSRVSTDHKEQKTSLENQQSHFIKMIQDNNNWTYIKSYVDEGVTGTSDIKRDSFMCMIDDAKNNEYDLIITKEISRFSRNTLDSIKYTRELLSYGVAVLFINDNINTALPDSELRLTIMASLAQDEIRRLSERVKFGMRESINKGNILGNNMLYGYKKDPITKELIIVKEQAQIVKRLFILYAINKKSLNEISKIFNNENIKTIQNKQWSPSTLARMIRNIKYKGYYCGKKTEVIDYISKKIKYLPKEDWIIYKDNKKIPIIINEKLWDKANNRLQRESKKKRQSQNKYPYSSKIICENHQTTFNRRKQCKKTNDITWLCSQYLKAGKKSCNSPNIRESELNYILKDIFDKQNIDLSNTIKILLNEYKNHLKEESYQKEKDKLINKKEKLLELVLNNSITKNEFATMNNKLNNEYKKINNRDKQNYNLDKLENIIKEKINSEYIFSKLTSQLLSKIVASKEQDIVRLKIYINYNNTKKMDKLIYKFNRGYNTKNTKRYTVKYEVSCFNQKHNMLKL